MHFSERDVGEFRIYAGAMEEQTGYVACVVVHRRRLARQPEVVYRDDRLFGGHRFEKPGEGLTRAMDAGHRAIRSEQARLQALAAVSVPAAQTQSQPQPQTLAA